MSRISAPNIVVSYLPVKLEEAIEFAKGTGRNDTATQNKYLFRISNDNILRFEHEYMFATSKTDNIGSLLTLECIDPDTDPENSFDFRFFGNTIESLNSKGTLKQLRDERLSELKKQKTFVDELKGNLTGPNNVQILSKRVTDTFTTNIDAETAKQLIYEGLADQIESNINTILGHSTTSAISGELADALLAASKSKITYSDVAGPFDNTVDIIGSFTFNTSSLLDFLDDIGIGPVDAPDILPTPYFYFYYGMNDDKTQWAGPVIAQFIKAKYNFSSETGKKTIELVFTSTYDFPAFSYLSMDKRGILVESQTPIYYALCTDSKNPEKMFGLKLLHKTIQTALSDYIKKATSDKCNVFITLPDISVIFDDVIDGYYRDAITTGSNRNIAIAEATLRCLSDMGFDVYLLRQSDIANTPSNNANTKPNNFEDFVKQQIRNGGEIQITSTPLQQPSKGSNPQKPTSASNSLNTLSPINLTTTKSKIIFSEFWEKSQYNHQTIVIGLQIKKSKLDPYMKPLKKILDGIANRLNPITPCFEVIENPEWAEAFINFIPPNSIAGTYLNKVIGFNKDNPTIIFGDSNLIEKYVFGKKYYELVDLLKKVSKTNRISNGLIPIDQQLRALLADNPANNTKPKGLYELDWQLFSSDYIINIAAKYFLKARDTAPVASFYTKPVDELDIQNLDLNNALNSNIPMLKLGGKESNILETNLNFNDFYFSIISKVYGLYSRLNQVILGTSAKDGAFVLDYFDKDLVTQAEKIFKNQKISDLSDPNAINDLFKELNNNKDFKSLPNSQKMDLLFYGLATKAEEIRNSSNTQGAATATIDPKLKVNPHLMFIALYANLVNQAFIGTVKTLPFFAMSGSPKSLPPVLLFIEEPSVPPYRRKKSVTAAFTGYWKILGYKHTITDSDVFTELYIIKDIRLDLPEILIPAKS